MEYVSMQRLTEKIEDLQRKIAREETEKNRFSDALQWARAEFNVLYSKYTNAQKTIESDLIEIKKINKQVKDLDIHSDRYRSNLIEWLFNREVYREKRERVAEIDEKRRLLYARRGEKRREIVQCKKQRKQLLPQLNEATKKLLVKRNYDECLVKIESLKKELSEVILAKRQALNRVEEEKSVKADVSDNKQRFDSTHIKKLQNQAATNIQRIREIAKSTINTVYKNPICPYCGKRLDYSASNGVHADHIYPVSKGGYSTESNMVFVCSVCNLSKRDMTLSEFIRKTKLDRNTIEERLQTLGKEY